MTFLFRSFFVVCISLTTFAKNSFQPQTAYLGNLEDDEIITVYNKPAINWKNCTKKTDNNGREFCEEAVGWPDKDSLIKIVGPDEKHRITDPFTGKDVNETFVKVWFRYTRDVKGSDGKINKIIKEDVGYLPKYVLTVKKQEAVFTTSIKKEAEDDCPPGQTLGKKTFLLSEQIAKVAKNQTVVSAADEISKVVGKCLVSPPTSRPKNLPNVNVYDAWVVPKIKAQPIPKLKNEQNKSMTQADLINIDALARTLYGEMGGCFKKGLQYPMAVARVAVNRLEQESKWEEFTATNVTRKNQPIPKLAQLLTTPEKFNNWMGRTNNGPLHQSLCPPAQAGKPYWNENAASKEEYAIWKNAVRIATEAVLYPNQFKSRSPGMKNVHFYTSGMGRFMNAKRVTASVDGRSVANTDCVELWNDPTPPKTKSSIKKRK